MPRIQKSSMAWRGFLFLRLTTKSFDTCISSHLIHRYKQFRYFVTIRQLHYLLKWLQTHMLKLAISLQSSMWTIVTFKTVEIPSYDSVTNACVNDVMFQINIQESVISTWHKKNDPQRFDFHDFQLQVNEIAGACHSCTSKHYLGRAVDLHNPSGQSTYMINLCSNMGGWAQNEGNHVHCQF